MLSTPFTRKDLPHNLQDPALSAVSDIVPSDTEYLERPIRGLFVGSEGDVHVTMFDGSVGKFPAVQAGAFLPIVAIRILETGTTAGNFTGLI